MFTKLRHTFYRLFRSRHIERWKEFLSLSQGELRIALFIANHGNCVTLDQLTNDLTHIGGDPRQEDSIRKIVDRMKERQKLKEDKEGYLSLKKPIRFTIKQEKISDSWFLAVLSLAIASFIIAILELGWLPMKVVCLVVVVGILIRILDNIIHETRW